MHFGYAHAIRLMWLGLGLRVSRIRHRFRVRVRVSRPLVRVHSPLQTSINEQGISAEIHCGTEAGLCHYISLAAYV